MKKFLRQLEQYEKDYDVCSVNVKRFSIHMKDRKLYIELFIEYFSKILFMYYELPIRRNNIDIFTINQTSNQLIQALEILDVKAVENILISDFI